VAALAKPDQPGGRDLRPRVAAAGSVVPWMRLLVVRGFARYMAGSVASARARSETRGDCRGGAQLQVCDQCLADIAGQRQTRPLMTLPVDLDLSGPPVLVVELDAGGLHRT